MKRILSLLLCVIMLLACMAGITISARAATEGTEGYYTYEVSNGKATITDVDTSISGDVTIPSALGGYPVIGIGNFAFRDCTDLTGVTFGKGITSIGSYVFNNCYKLRSLIVFENNNKYHSEGNCVIETETRTLIAGCSTSQIPDKGSVTSIGDTAFYGCAGSEVIIPNCITSIGNNAFTWSTEMKRVTIGNGVTNIGEGAFSFCWDLTSITIPDNVTSIGDGLFSFSDQLENVVIGSGVTRIDPNMFNLCGSLNKLTVSENNKKYHSEGNCIIETASKTLIIGCNTSRIPIDGSVTSIGNRAFADRINLTNIIIPNCVTDIESYAFECCDSLSRITFEGNAPNIGDNCFNEVTAIAYYPAGNATWTAAVMQDYGGDITWVAEETTIPGNLNDDEVVDNQDVAYLLWYTLFPEDYPVSVDADFNGDGLVDNQDVAYLLWYTLFPEDYPLQ